MNYFGEVLTGCMEGRGLSVEELAERSGLGVARLDAEMTLPDADRLTAPGVIPALQRVLELPERELRRLQVAYYLGDHAMSL